MADITPDDVVIVRDRDGAELLRRPRSPLELAQQRHGPAQQERAQLHPPCHRPPASWGISTYRFADGHRWCACCRTAWLPDAASDQLTASFLTLELKAPRCSVHDAPLAPLTGGWWCPAGGHYTEPATGDPPGS